MKQIRFLKDGSKRIKLGDTMYRPLTLEQILNIESLFYAGTNVDEDGDAIDAVENPVSEWFNYKGLTYIKA